MLKWCSYCQRFMGEVPEYDNFLITHGLCADCGTRRHQSSAKRDLDHAVFLREIFRKLFDSGRKNNFRAAEEIIENAIAANCRPVDILIGMIAPMLHRIGEDWRRGTITVDDEHRFTSFCEQVVDLIARKSIAAVSATDSHGGAATALLLNAPGNGHTLAIRILALWLEHHGIGARIADEQAGVEALLALLATARPKYLLISMALLPQRQGVAAIAERVLAMPEGLRPRIIVGGYAVKVGMAPEMPGVEFVADIGSLSLG